MNTTTVDNEMERIVTRNLLKYAAGRNIFCPSCGDIMDWRRTVIAELKVDGKPARLWTQCAKCWDKAKDSVARAVSTVRLEGKAVEMEITDGREFSKRS